MVAIHNQELLSLYNFAKYTGSSLHFINSTICSSVKLIGVFAFFRFGLPKYTLSLVTPMSFH